MKFQFIRGRIMEDREEKDSIQFFPFAGASLRLNTAQPPPGFVHVQVDHTTKPTIRLRSLG